MNAPLIGRALTKVRTKYLQESRRVALGRTTARSPPFPAHFLPRGSPLSVGRRRGRRPDSECHFDLMVPLEMRHDPADRLGLGVSLVVRRCDDRLRHRTTRDRAAGDKLDGGRRLESLDRNFTGQGAKGHRRDPGVQCDAGAWEGYARRRRGGRAQRGSRRIRGLPSWRE